MANFSWAEDGAAWVDVINGILDIAGSNFNAPYDSSSQPSDNVSRNFDDLLQYQLPGGTNYQGYADPSFGESMGSSINSLIANISGFMSAFGLILPIIGVIRGIIEVICALLNPFAIIKAIINLFKKWIPPFISLFPPLAGIIIILSTIKLIIAMILYVLTVIVPIVQLIINNIKMLEEAFGPTGNKSQKDAVREKLLAMLIEILNQLGVIALFKPILDLILAILELVAGFPCKSEKDSACCNDISCPVLFKNLPKGKGFLIPAFFGDSPPLYAWNIFTFTGNKNVPSLKRYMQSFGKQLSAMLDEKIEEADHAGGIEDSSTFKVKITGARGEEEAIDAAVMRVSGSNLVVLEPALVSKIGIIDYEVIPNWENLIKYNVVGLGCHPDIAAARDALENLFPNLDKSAIDNNPELATFGDDYTKNMGDMNRNLNKIRNAVMDVVFDGGDKIPEDYKKRIPNNQPTYNALDAVNAATDFISFDPNTDKTIADPPALPPYDDQIAQINDAQDEIIDILTNYMTDLKNTMNSVLARNTHKTLSNFDVDKNVVKAGIKDKATIYVVPRDATGTPLLKGLPSGVDISVSIYSDFGILGEQVVDKVTGVVSVDLISLFPGDAKVTAKVNVDFIEESIANTTQVKSLDVKFVSDATLPKRRFVSKKSSNSKRGTTIGSTEREPGGK